MGLLQKIGVKKGFMRFAIANGFHAQIDKEERTMSIYRTAYHVTITAPHTFQQAHCGQPLGHNTIVGGTILGREDEAIKWAQTWTPERLIHDNPILLNAVKSILQKETQASQEDTTADEREPSVVLHA